MRRNDPSAWPRSAENANMTEVMTTAATEAIRIAQTYLPRSPWKRQQALANEIADVIALCEAEVRQEIARDLETMAKSAGLL